MSKRSHGKISKTVSLALISLLICLNPLVGCGPSKNTQASHEAKNPFTFDYKLDNSNIAFFTKGDSINTLLASSPFYSGSQSLPSQKAGDFDKARAAKVKEIIAEADKLVKTTAKIRPKLANIRTSFLSYLTTSFKEEPKFKEFTKGSFGQISLLMSKEQIAESQYKSMDTRRITDPYTKSFEDYLKVSKAVELGSLYLEDVNNIGAYAAIAMKASENHPNSRIIQANKKLDSDMQSLDDIKDDLASVASSIKNIDYGIKQLRTADYYLAKEACQFMASSLPDLKAKAKKLTPRDGLTADNIAFIQIYLNYFDKLQGDLSKNLDSTDKHTLVSIDQDKETGNSIAYAAESGQNYGKALDSLSQPLKSEDKESSGFFSSGWSAIKKTVNGTKLVIGLGVDTIGTAFRNVSQVGCGIWYGNTTEEIMQDMHNNSMELVNNYNKGISGASTFKTAGEYLENVEKTAGDTAGSAVESQIGAGWTSWGVSKIAKASVGMFTGFGKGIYKVVRTDASYGEIAEGTLDIGLSFVGGSKVVIKASQLPGLLKGLAQEGSLLTKQGFNLLDTVGANIDKHIFTKEIADLIEKNNLTKTELLTLISNSIELQARNAMTQALKEERAQLIKQITEILKEGGKAGLEESVAGIKQSLTDLIKTSFTNNMQGYLEAISTAMGLTSKDYIDNLVGSWADDYIKGLIKEAIDGAPQPEEISGQWNGTWVITEVSVPESNNSSNSQNSDGCDFNIDWNALKGKSIPLAMNLTVNPDGSGTMDATSTGSDGKQSKGEPTPFQYRGGKVVIDRTMQDANMHMEGQVQRTESGYAINGTLSASSKDGTLIKGTWRATKAK